MKNLQFAQTVEPDNAKISQKLSWAQQQRQSGLPTIPSTIEEELETNPFMRADLPQVQVLPFPLNQSLLPHELEKLNGRKRSVDESKGLETFKTAMQSICPNHKII